MNSKAGASSDSPKRPCRPNIVLSRLAHAWRIEGSDCVSPALIQDFIRPAVQAIPDAMARRIKPCRIALPDTLEGNQTVSRWTELRDFIEIEVAATCCSHHDLVLELLLCIGQALWEQIDTGEETAWLSLLRAEIDEGVLGEIDEQAFEARRRLLASRCAARSTLRLLNYARASFASTVAEYVHCLWHDVRVRNGAEHLPPKWLRRRLELMGHWFPPDPGYLLFYRGSLRD